MLRVLLITIVVISVPLCAFADSLSVTNLAFGTGIENRAITGVDTVFTVDQGRLYCWTVVETAGAGDTIYHLWSHNGRAVQKISLAVRGMLRRGVTPDGVREELGGEHESGLALAGPRGDASPA